MIFRASQLIFDANSCLRAACALNKCEDCVQICPQSAISIKRDRIDINLDDCIMCGACVGVCKIEALSLQDFNIPVFIAWAAKKLIVLSCEQIGVCLAVFKSEHFASLALRSDSRIVADIAKCANCVLNKNGSMSSLIVNNLQNANKLIKSYDKRIDEHLNSDDRRAFLKKLKSSKTLVEDFSGDAKLPANRFFALSLKEPSADIVKTQKKIDAHECTNCNECALFCPTNALESVNDALAILHRPSECIGCGICSAVCVPKAISKESVSLDEWGRSKILVAFEIKKCTKCGSVFATATKSKHCDGCAKFGAEFPDMFKTAQELENDNL